jgi:hypothetical protein
VEGVDDYSRSKIVFLLSNYQTWAQRARLPKRTEAISTGPSLGAGGAPQAGWNSTAVLYADLERALQRIPFRHAQITFMAASVGGSDWNHGLTGWTKAFLPTRQRQGVTWLGVIGEWWGIEPSEVQRVVTETVDAIYVTLNGRAGMDVAEVLIA